MAKNYKKRQLCGLFVILLGLVFVPLSVALATSVDRIGICNLEGYAGETIEQEITLEGTQPEEREGFWETHYKKVEGDDEQMDITNWISFEPEEYTITQGEIKTFTVKIEIPKNAGPGLWGATAETACREGHSEERRSYIIFKDTPLGGNVYSGLLLPISVNVLESPNPLAPLFNFAQQNWLVILMAVVIVVLLSLMLRKRKKFASSA